MDNEYYRDLDRGQLLSDLTDFLHTLVHISGQDYSKEITDEFDKLIPQLPYYGLAKPTETIIFTAQWLAVYKVLRAKGKSTKQIGSLIFAWDAYEGGKLTAEEKRQHGDDFFSKESVQAVGKNVTNDQSRFEYRHQATYIVGDGKEFDLGFDMTACFLISFYKKHNAEDLIPYICAFDFYYSKTFDLGLERKKTLANGDAVCDFRYKRGRPTILPVMN